MTDRQSQKKRAITMLREQVPQQVKQLADIDPRLLDYYHDLCVNSGTGDDDPYDHHNLYELLAALKQLRIMRRYVIDVEKVQQVIRLREGEWHREGRTWKYDSGGLLLPGSHGPTHYRWMNFQIFILTAMYGARAWIDTEVENGTRPLLPTEREGRNGTIEDLRRLCTDFTFYAPRKTDKTGFSAYNNFLYFMLEDADAEIYCCANSQAQSKLLYDRTQMFIRQMDPQGRRIRFTASTTNWKPGQIRSAQLLALSAGGKTKDGLFAQLCCADEYGSAEYVNEKSDMGALVNVVLSSMGPRREPMMFTSTTAGNITSGPFIDKLDGIKKALLTELDRTDDDGTPDDILTDPNDRWMILLLEPDEWRMEQEILLTSKTIRKKVNPALGIIVQNSFYEQSIADSRLDPLKKNETLTKLLNVYQSGRVTDWIKSDRIRPLQDEGRRITDCKYDKGWNVFVGMDFSLGDDLFAISYLGVDYKQSPTMAGRFFADTEAWVLEDTLNKSSNRALFEKWIEQGWLRVCPGEAFNPDFAINELMGKTQQGVNLAMFGYDPAQSKQPINTLKAWLQTLGIDAKTIEQMVVPVPQTALNFNPVISDIEDWIKAPEPWIRFSASPLWPWCFGNARVELSRNDLRRIVKATASEKIDPVHALLDAAFCFNLSEGRIQQ